MIPSLDNPYQPPAAELDAGRPQITDDASFWSPGMVSVWIGAFPSPEFADDYFAETYHHDQTPISQFAADFGFRGYRSDYLEFHFDDAESYPLSELLEECSFSMTYGEEALAEAAKRGMESTQGVALLFNFDFRPGAVLHSENGFLTFLGAFRYEMSTGNPWLDRLTHETGRHPAAYLSILDAYRTGSVARPGEHVDARTLCDWLLFHAHETYGAKAREQLTEFGLVSSEAVGAAVDEMVAAGVIKRGANDRPEDFVGLFRLEDWTPPAGEPA